MESDVEEGEIRESELLSPLSDNALSDTEAEQSSKKKYRKVQMEAPRASHNKRKFDKEIKGGGAMKVKRKVEVVMGRGSQLNDARKRKGDPRRVTSPRRVQNIPNFQDNRRQRRFFKQDFGKKRWKSGENEGKGFNRNFDQNAIRNNNRKRNFSSEDRHNKNGPVPPHWKKRQNFFRNKVREERMDDGDDFVFPLPKFATQEIEDSCESREKDSPESPVIYEYQPPSSPDDFNAGRTLEQESLKVVEEDTDIEILSVIGGVKEQDWAELIVIDSTSSSDSEQESEEPTKEASISPVEAAKAASIDEATEVSVPQICQENADAALGNSVDEEDLEVLELRRQALEGLYMKLPDSQTEKITQPLLYDPAIPTNSPPLPQMKEVPDDSEKENELELDRLRAKLLSDLEKKRNKADDAANLKAERKKRMHTCSKKRSREQRSSHSSSSRRNSPHSGHKSHNNHDARNRSHDSTNSSKCLATKSVSTSKHNSPSKISPHSSPDSVGKTIPSVGDANYNKTSKPTISNVPSLSVSITPDGKHRTVVASGTVESSPIPVVSQMRKNGKRIVRIVDPENFSATSPRTSPVKRKRPASAASKSTKVICTSGPQKVLTNKSKPTQQQPRTTNGGASSSDMYKITRTISNPYTKSKYRPKKNFHVQRSVEKKKVNPIVIPLRDNDVSTEDEGEEQTSPENVLPDSFHSKLDSFLKLARANASRNLIPCVSAATTETTVTTMELLPEPNTVAITKPSEQENLQVTDPQNSSKSSESIADQMIRTREELQLREKILRATFKKSELKLKLAKTENEFLSSRQSATNLLGSAIDRIHQHTDKVTQCVLIEQQVEKLRKQLEVAEKSLYVRKMEASRLHDNAVLSLNEAFEMRSKSVHLGVQCKNFGQELDGEKYKIPSSGASEMLAKFKEVFKLTTKDELQKGQINFKKLEKEIISSFIACKVSNPPPPQRLNNPGGGSGEIHRNSLVKVPGGLTRHVDELEKSREMRCQFILYPVPKNPNCPFAPYESPLYWLNNSDNKWYIENINKILCINDIKGSCKNQSCKFQHIATISTLQR